MDHTTTLKKTSKLTVSAFSFSSISFIHHFPPKNLKVFPKQTQVVLFSPGILAAFPLPVPGDRNIFTSADTLMVGSARQNCRSTASQAAMTGPVQMVTSDWSANLES